jgi:hypothetical protein
MDDPYLSFGGMMMNYVSIKIWILFCDGEVFSLDTSFLMGAIVSKISDCIKHTQVFNFLQGPKS